MRAVKIFTLICVLLIAINTLQAYAVDYQVVYQLDGTTILSTALRQQIDDVSTAQRYRIGTRLQIGDRVYRYMKFGTDSGIGAGEEYGLCMATAVTDSNLTLFGFNLINSATLSIALAGATLNQYEGGFIKIADTSDSGTPWGAEILSNTATASGSISVSLENGIPFQITSTDVIQIAPNIYSDVYVPSNDSTAIRETIIGVCMAFKSTTDYEGSFGWIQTWGPCPGIQLYAKNWLNTANVGGRSLYYVGQGKVTYPTAAGVVQGSALGVSYQRVGYLLNRNSASSGNAYPTAWLTIAP